MPRGCPGGGWAPLELIDALEKPLRFLLNQRRSEQAGKYYFGEDFFICFTSHSIKLEKDKVKLSVNCSEKSGCMSSEMGMEFLEQFGLR